ncbi:ATP-binding protein [Fretibacter rubidus]|uniref:ATP-binding protein n=1 Tax=Fretibacter rubidus TaxID=570162 RepID=UPI00352B6784
MNLTKHVSSLLKKGDTPDATDTNAQSLGVNDVLMHALDSSDTLGYAVFDSNNSVLKMSPTYMAMLGISDSDAQDLTNHRDVLNFITRKADPKTLPSPDVVEKVYALTNEQIQKRENKTRIRTEKMDDGRILQFRSKFTTTGHLITYVSDVTDMTERDVMLKHGLTLGTSGYWAYNYLTQKSDFSDYISDTLSDNELEQIRMNGLLAVVHKDDLERASMMFLECRSNHSRMDGQFRIHTEKKGTMWIRVIGEFQYCDDGQTPMRFVAFINNVTADVNNQQELKDAQELSRVKTEFLARMSHEIKTPLNAIVGMTDALLDEVESAEARETANYIADAAQNLDRVLSQTLEHARLSSTKLVLDIYENDPKAIVKSTAALFKKACKDKGINLKLRIADGVPDIIKTDPTRLRQCLTNLLSNAVKFTDSGQIDIVLATVRRPNGASNLVLAVKDTGIGMSEKAAQNVFKPFAQADETISRRFGGSGLGMAITSQIVDAMEGNIRIQSELGKGTTILMTLPVDLSDTSHKAADVLTPLPTADAADNVPAKVETAKAVSSPLPSAAPATANAAVVTPPVSKRPSPIAIERNSLEAAKPTITKKVAIDPTEYSGFDVLVVEDNPINQKVVGKLLAGHVRSVTFAFHGDEALKILQRQNFDVILMDIHMPVKDGIETTLEIRNSGETWADIVIVALTADPDYQQKRICRNIGMNDTIAKPVRRKELLEAMARVLDERKQKRQAVA